MFADSGGLDDVLEWLTITGILLLLLLLLFIKLLSFSMLLALLSEYTDTGNLTILSLTLCPSN
jgi:hypothetical protein